MPVILFTSKDISQKHIHISDYLFLTDTKKVGRTKKRNGVAITGSIEEAEINLSIGDGIYKNENEGEEGEGDHFRY